MTDESHPHIPVYRRFSESRPSSVIGYSLFGTPAERIDTLDDGVDYVAGLTVRLFATQKEARAYQAGLADGGVDTIICASQAVDGGWATLLEVQEDPDQENQIRYYDHRGDKVIEWVTGPDAALESAPAEAPSFS